MCCWEGMVVETVMMRTTSSAYGLLVGGGVVAGGAYGGHWWLSGHACWDKGVRMDLGVIIVGLRGWGWTEGSE